MKYLWCRRFDQKTNEIYFKSSSALASIRETSARAEILKKILGFLVETKTPKGHFEMK